MKGEYIGRVGVYGRGWCIYIFTEYVPSKRGTAEAGGMMESRRWRREGVWLSWLEWICVLAQWADASGAPRQLSQKAAVVSPL